MARVDEVLTEVLRFVGFSLLGYAIVEAWDINSISVRKREISYKSDNEP